MMHKAWHSIEEVPYCFSKSSIKFPGPMGPKINDLNPILSKNTRPVAAIKSLIFAWSIIILQIDILSTSPEIGHMWVPLNLINDKSTLVQVMAWYCQATSHYLNQCWLRSLTRYGVTQLHIISSVVFSSLIKMILERFTIMVQYMFAQWACKFQLNTYSDA